MLCGRFEGLKQRLIDIWSGMQQSVIDETIDEWHKELKACVKASGALTVISEHYCNCLNCFASTLTWFSAHVIFVWTWRFPLGILVGIGGLCCKLFLVCIKHLRKKIIYFLLYLFFCITYPNIIKIGLRSKKYSTSKKVVKFFETQCKDILMWNCYRRWYPKEYSLAPSKQAAHRYFDTLWNKCLYYTVLYYTLLQGGGFMHQH